MLACADPVYPPSLYRAVSYVSTLGVPVYILENGMPSKADDERRTEWIDGCMAEVALLKDVSCILLSTLECPQHFAEPQDACISVWNVVLAYCAVQRDLIGSSALIEPALLTVMGSFVGSEMQFPHCLSGRQTAVSVS